MLVKTPFIAFGLSVIASLPAGFAASPPINSAVAQSQTPCARTDVSGSARTGRISQDRRFAVDRGAWSSATVSLLNTLGSLHQNPERAACVYSPDGKKTVEMQGEQIFVTVGPRRFKTDFGDLTNPELGWSPDSSRLFVTWTDGGAVGTWHVDVYDVSQNGLAVLKGLPDKAREDFDQRIRGLPIDPSLNNPKDRKIWQETDYCEPNVVGNQWLNGSKELLISVLVPDSSGCRYMAEFYAYRVGVPGGDILERYTAAEAQKAFNRENLPRIVR
jgi:hypothetical protein